MLGIVVVLPHRQTGCAPVSLRNHRVSFISCVHSLCLLQFFFDPLRLHHNSTQLQRSLAYLPRHLRVAPTIQSLPDGWVTAQPLRHQLLPRPVVNYYYLHIVLSVFVCGVPGLAPGGGQSRLFLPLTPCQPCSAGNLRRLSGCHPTLLMQVWNTFLSIVSIKKQGSIWVDCGTLSKDLSPLHNPSSIPLRTFFIPHPLSPFSSAIISRVL